MTDWLHATENGTDATHTFVPITMAFSKCFRHPCRHDADSPETQGYPYPHSPVDQNSTVAAFMIARPASGTPVKHACFIAAKSNGVLPPPRL